MKGKKARTSWWSYSYLYFILRTDIKNNLFKMYADHKYQSQF